MSSEIVKPYLSPTQLEMIAKCPEQFRRRYVEGERLTPGIAAHKGSGVHGGAAYNFSQKVESHKDLPEKEIVEAAVETFRTRLKDDDYQPTDDERSMGRKKTVTLAIDSTAKMAGFHARQQAPDYQPIYVEEQVRKELPGCSHDLLGIVDLIDDQGGVTDFKTSKRSKPQWDADTSLQLTTYAVLHEELRGEAPSAIRLDTIVEGKQTRRQVLHTVRGVEDARVLASRINAALAIIQSGVYPPTSPGNWYCSARFCGYASTCPYYYAGEKK